MQSVRLNQSVTVRSTHGRASSLRRSRLHVRAANALCLKSVGTGDWSDLDTKQQPPTTIDLSAGGTFMLGAESTPTRSLDIVLDVPTVSGLHAKLRVVGDHRVLVTDLGSTNGTMVNGRAVTGLRPYGIVPGDVIVFGDDKFAKFELVDDGSGGGDASVTAAEVAGSVPADVAEARAWIEGWKNSKSLASGGTSDAEEDNVSEARAWIAAWKASQGA